MPRLPGTPIENKVDELHSIFDFVNYGYLGDQERSPKKLETLTHTDGRPKKRTCGPKKSFGSKTSWVLVEPLRTCICLKVIF